MAGDVPVWPQHAFASPASTSRRSARRPGPVRGDDEAAGLDERIALLRPQLIRLDADILCLQEVDGQRSRKARRPGRPGAAAA